MMIAGVTRQTATCREWIGLAILAIPCILYAMDLTVLNLAIPSLSGDVKPGAAQLLWIVDAYGFMAAGWLLTMGTLGDRIGRRKLLFIGSAIFGIVSVGATFARSAELLIAARALLGVASAAMAPSTLSLISNMFHDDRERTFAVSIWVASFSFGGAIGPAVGGLILAHFSWPAVFAVPVPFLALLLLVGPVVLPEYRNPAPGRLDLSSAGLSLAAVLPVIHGVKLFAEGGNSFWAASAIVLGCGFGLLFVRRQARLTDPLLDLRLFGRPGVSAALGLNLLDFFVGFGILLLVAQYLQLVLGLTPLQAGLWSMPAGFGSVFGSLLTSPMLKVMRPAYVLSSGLALGSAALVAMTYAVGAHSLILVVVGSVLLSIGTAPGTAIIADLVVSAAPQERSGAASALSETTAEFGGALGIALLGSLATFVYRHELSQIVPGGSPIALRGIGAAVNLSQTTGNAALLSAAQFAYAHAVSIAFLTGGGVLLLSAVTSAVTFRKAMK